MLFRALLLATFLVGCGGEDFEEAAPPGMSAPTPVAPAPPARPTGPRLFMCRYTPQCPGLIGRESEDLVCATSSTEARQSLRCGGCPCGSASCSEFGSPC